jgi:hypothetical protein
LYGEEEFLIQEALETFKSFAVQPEAKDFNFEV